MTDGTVQSQTERLRYTLQHNSWDAQSDNFKIRVFRELAELSTRLDALALRPLEVTHAE